jgi:hypothetical protein
VSGARERCAPLTANSYSQVAGRDDAYPPRGVRGRPFLGRVMSLSGSRVTRLLAAVSGVVTAAILAWSIAKDVPHSWSVLRTERADYAGYSQLQRDQSYGAALPLPMNIFDFYREYLRSGDRYFIQIQNGTFGRFIDKETAVRTVGRLYLVPAIEAPDLAHANVVLSWDSDPGLLHLHYTQQARLGQQLVFVSRIARDG